MRTDEFAVVADELASLTDSDCAVILIGSAARGRRTERSDIDILFVAGEKVPSIPVISGYHIKFSAEADFLRRLQEGDDFEAWCVRLGIPLVDRGVWERIKEASRGVWPRWETKVVHGIRRLFNASQQFKLGDYTAAREELVFVLGHISRSILLRGGTFPLSRPELADQVRSIGYPRLADIHERLRNADEPSKSDLSLGLRYSKKLLAHLDRSTYSRIALQQTKILREKEAKRAAMHFVNNGLSLNKLR
jgi:predicted nucleotidyltransferase